MSEQTCTEQWCPELCEAIGKVVISMCDTRYTEDGEPGDCNCVCETERGGRACFQHGVRGAAFTGERITSETECDLGPGGREFCEPVCETECDFGFGVLDASCEFNNHSTLDCECVCGQCQFLGYSPSKVGLLRTSQQQREKA